MMIDIQKPATGAGDAHVTAPQKPAPPRMSQDFLPRLGPSTACEPEQASTAIAFRISLTGAWSVTKLVAMWARHNRARPHLEGAQDFCIRW